MRAVLGPDLVLRFRGEGFRCAIGAAGVTRHKREGDGATPAGDLPLRRVLYRADRVPRPMCAVPVEPIGEADGWCDDVSHSVYNTQVVLPHVARCEELWRRDGLYDLIGVLGWNDAPVVRGLGSAIFLHVARPDWGPTEGCVALGLCDLQRLLSQGCDGVVISD